MTSQPFPCGGPDHRSTISPTFTLQYRRAVPHNQKQDAIHSPDIDFPFVHHMPDECTDDDGEKEERVVGHGDEHELDVSGLSREDVQVEVGGDELVELGLPRKRYRRREHRGQL